MLSRVVRWISCVLWLSCVGCDSARSPAGDKPALRLGWITTWATAGQIMEVISRTTIAADHGVALELKRYTLGPQMNEAALHGDLDGIVIGVVPTISLLAASSDWTVVAKVVEFNQALVVQSSLAVEQVGDLQERAIGVPFGSGAHPFLLSVLHRSNVSLDAVRLVNMKPPEQAIAFRAGMVDAVATWEPVTTMLVGQGAGRVIHRERHDGFLTLRSTIVEQRPETAQVLRAIFREAHLYNAQHRRQVDQWYAEDSGFERGAIEAMEVIDRNFRATRLDEVSVSLNAPVIEAAQRIADEMLSFELIGSKIDFGKRCGVDPSL